MPFSHYIDEERDLLVIEAEGLLTPHLLKECVEAYIADPAFHTGIDALIEIGEDAFVRLAEGVSQAVALVRGDFLREVKVLLAEVNQEQEFKVACTGGSSRARTFFMSGIGLVAFDGEFEAFESREDALRWLRR